MAYVPLDQLTDKHELLPFDPDDPDWTQVVVVEHGGRTREVIVPLFHNNARIGEVVATAVDGAVVFLLCRYDRSFDDFYGTLGLLVVAIPYKDGRYRAAIAHDTYSLEGNSNLAGLGLYPPPRADLEAGVTGGVTGPVAETLLRARRAEPFASFRLRLADGSAILVASRESLAWNGRASTVVVFGEGQGIEIIKLSQVMAIEFGSETLPLV